MYLLLFLLLLFIGFGIWYYHLNTKNVAPTGIRVEVYGERFEVPTHPEIFIEVGQDCNGDQHWSRCDKDDKLGVKRSHLELVALFTERQLTPPEHLQPK